MKCPNCGQTIPEPQYSRNDPMMIRSICNCGVVDTQPDPGDDLREDYRMDNSYTVNHTVDVDEVLDYIRSNPTAFREQLRALSLGVDPRIVKTDDPGMYILRRNGYWL